MRTIRFFGASTVLLAVALMIGCTTADLYPVPGPVGIDWCRLHPETGGLLVEVRNNGPLDAAESTAGVEFVGLYGMAYFVPAIPAGTSTMLGPTSIPPSCFNPDCDFQITVDVFNNILESNETNNIADGLCLG